MVELELPVKTGEPPWEAGAEPPEVAYWSYQVPCAGVRYYTFDSRPLLSSRMKRWSQKPEEPTGRDGRLE
jgi:hypothetical protein